ncbi:hypothetical protein, partial [Mycobacterium sp.]|uniref:hypothetical protein n=1 Tax=Mycobacterium sp. TaxID=1785 RepID=UPI0025D62E2B
LRDQLKPGIKTNLALKPDGPTIGDLPHHLQDFGNTLINLDLSCNSAFAGVVNAKGALPQG